MVSITHFYRWRLIFKNNLILSIQKKLQIPNSSKVIAHDKVNLITEMEENPEHQKCSTENVSIINENSCHKGNYRPVWVYTVQGTCLDFVLYKDIQCSIEYPVSFKLHRLNASTQLMIFRQHNSLFHIVVFHIVCNEYETKTKYNKYFSGVICLETIKFDK